MTQDGPLVRGEISPTPREIDGVEVATIIAGLSSDRWRDEVNRLTDENRMLRSACERYQTAFDSQRAEMEKQRDAHWRDLTACRSELASLALWLQDRQLLPTPGGDNYALVVGAAVEYMLSMELAVVALNEDRKDLTFMRQEETDDLRTTVAMLWDLMTDDQCIRFSFSPVRYECVQDLWRKWADRQGER